jgi:hypothetical protein
MSLMVPHALFRVGDRVQFQFGPQSPIGEVVEDRGFLASGGRRLYRVKFDFDADHNAKFIEVPEDQLKLA